MFSRLRESIRRRMRNFSNPLKLFVGFDKSGPRPLDTIEYQASFPDEVKHEAFRKAWEVRNFEIEMYWKRATYFWAFIASIFAAYFALVSSENYQSADRYSHVEVYLVICTGLVMSVAWWLTNKGSKAWQKNWEAHVDLLEDDFTGPLYKTIYPANTYSVSKINEIASVMFVIVWMVLAVQYRVDQNLCNFPFRRVNWFVLSTTVATLLVLSAMLFGYGKGRFGEHYGVMHRRRTIYDSEEV